MARYIDAEKLIEKVEGTTWYHIGLQGNLIKGARSDIDTPLYKADDIYKAITETPTADVVEVEKYNELREDFIDFACSGVNNLAPYCKNRCVECVDGRGWCRYTVKCKGFNPDGERRDT